MCDTKSILLTGAAAGLAMTGVGMAGMGAAGGSMLAGSSGGAMLGGGLLASGFLQAYAMNQQAEAQQEAYDRQARIGEAQAADAIARGAEAEDAHRRQVRLLEGEQRAAMAAGGGQLGVGTNATILAQTAHFGELDALTIRANAAREAWGFKTGADTTRYQGELVRSKAKGDALGTILTSGIQAYGAFKK